MRQLSYNIALKFIRNTERMICSEICMGNVRDSILKKQKSLENPSDKRTTRDILIDTYLHLNQDILAHSLCDVIIE
jgi:hypothetical protein